MLETIIDIYIPTLFYGYGTCSNINYCYHQMCIVTIICDIIIIQCDVVLSNFILFIYIYIY
jgi:hypothetical protein